MAAAGKCLVLVIFVCGKSRRGGGQIEGVAMPVQNGRFAAQGRQAGRAAGLGQRHRPPADFLEVAGIDAAAQRFRHQLRAEADAERRPLPTEAMLDQRDFTDNEGVVLGLVDADRAAENDHEICIPDRGVVEVVDRGIAERDVPALALHDGREQAQILKRNVAEGDGRSTALKHLVTLRLLYLRPPRYIVSNIAYCRRRPDAFEYPQVRRRRPSFPGRP